MNIIDQKYYKQSALNKIGDNTTLTELEYKKFRVRRAKFEALRFSTLNRLAGCWYEKLSRKDYGRYKKLVKNEHDAVALVETWADRTEIYPNCLGHVPWFARGFAYNIVVGRFNVKV